MHIARLKQSQLSRPSKELRDIDKPFFDLGPDLEFEKMVGTKGIIEKASKLLHVEEAVPSDSSEEPFNVNLTLDQEKRIKKKKLKIKKEIENR